MQIYQVGGAIRDELLGTKVKDRDWVVTGATPEAMLALGYKQVGKDFPVFLHPDSKEEYALARTERKVASGYHGFTFDTSTEVTLEQDLLRRDITINAIARDSDGALIDPFNGQRDLEARIIRHISPAFAEDPLRVLRVARFSARLDFDVAAETLDLMQQLSASGELQTLPPERIWVEMEKALNGEQPRRFFQVLRDCGALQAILPELDKLFGVPQPPQHHPEIDSGLHTLLSLDVACRLSDDPVVRFAVLVHDLGKGTTPAEMLPAHHGHEERGVKLIKQLATRLHIPKKYRELAVIVSHYHLICHRVAELRATTILKYLEAMDAFRRPQRFADFLLACEADARGRTGLEDRDYPQAGYFQTCLAACQAVDTGTLTATGLQGLELAAALRQERLKAVKKATKPLNNQDSTVADH
ncbi:MAG: multifunctional CCA addition/repair protein [Gammaproteobacteria bacterium]